MRHRTLRQLLEMSSEFKQFVIVLFLLGTAGAQTPKSEMLRLESSAAAMGATYSLVIYDEDRAKMEAASDAAYEEARRLDDLLSNYKPDSEWSKVNREASERPVAVSRELFDVIAACVKYSRESEGAFDITVGPLMNVWGFYKGTGHLPKSADVKTAMGRIGYQNIVLDEVNRTIAFKKKGLNLDPGGIGKGYAVDRIADLLRARGIKSALVAGSGSSIYAIGTPPDEPEGWSVEIKDPKDDFKAVAEVHLKDQSMSTSGSYEKFFVADGKVYSHIMDPRTGYPSQGTLSVSVITPRTIDSEAWAKPYFINGPKWTKAHLAADFKVYFCTGSNEKEKVEQKCGWLQ